MNKENIEILLLYEYCMNEFLERKGDVGRSGFVFARSLISFLTIMSWRHPGKFGPGGALALIYCHCLWCDHRFYTYKPIESLPRHKWGCSKFRKEALQNQNFILRYLFVCFSTKHLYGQLFSHLKFRIMQLQPSFKSTGYMKFWYILWGTQSLNLGLAQGPLCVMCVL